ncbi:LAMI_0G00958g1_1 [Lachancea mirantina]|uniref:LAMI_0G00958g1_1 n=1 Tax=Lachancea mirantina TaxID=1230905 RepID=A0A1G4K7B1_9SACH|nr:LAMI_0G00958g1_1 [Lachancea mirantina]
MGSHRPRLIILVRHGESVSNKDKTVNQHMPNHLIPLTENGWREAHHAGAHLLSLLNVDNNEVVKTLCDKYDHTSEDVKHLKQNYKRLDTDIDTKIAFYTSPYRRTRETLRALLDVIDEYNEINCGLSYRLAEPYQPTGNKRSAHWSLKDFPHGFYKNEEFQQKTERQIKSSQQYIHYCVKDEPRIREQDFGNFQEVSAMREVMNKRSHYGHFFFRFPQGESAADVYDRCATFQETLFRHTKPQSKGCDVVVLVTHGIYLRVFLMKWFRFTYEEFESFTNVPNGSLVVMELDPEVDRYVLRTTLPKWC